MDFQETVAGWISEVVALLLHTATLLTATLDNTTTNTNTAATWVVSFKFDEGYSCLQTIATKQ